ITALAIDPSTRRLYAAWAYPQPHGPDTLGVWTSADAGATWTGPTIIATGTFAGPPSIVAGQGKAYVAVATAPGPSEPCSDAGSRGADVVVASADGPAWSPVRNLTSCAPHTVAGFRAPKLALDESGHLYLVTSGQEAGRPTRTLWYLDTVAGGWSAPARVPG